MTHHDLIACGRTACNSCGRELSVGEEAWAADWKVLDPATGAFHWDTYYTCEDCHHEGH